MDVKKSVYILYIEFVFFVLGHLSSPYNLTAWCQNSMLCQESTFNLTILTKNRRTLRIRV